MVGPSGTLGSRSLYGHDSTVHLLSVVTTWVCISGLGRDAVDINMQVRCAVYHKNCTLCVDWLLMQRDRENGKASSLDQR